MESVIKRDFNGAAKFFLVLSMFATIMAIINSFLKISNMGLLGYEAPSTLTIEIVIDFLILAAAVLTFMKKPYGLIALTALFIIRMFATIPWDGDTSAAYMLGGKSVYFIRDFGLFAIAMCFKKNGISGWKSMLASEEYVAAHTVTKDTNTVAENTQGNTEDKVDAEKSGVVEDEEKGFVEEKSNLTDNQIESDNAIVETSSHACEEVVSIAEKDAASKESKEGNIVSFVRLYNNLSKTGRVIVLSLSALFLLLVVLFAVVILKPYPEHITRFGDKLKYSLNRPNDKLANELFQKAMDSRHEGYFFYETGDKKGTMWSTAFYRNPDKYSDEIEYKDFYKVLDTIKNKSSIAPSDYYAVRWHDSYNWGTGTGEQFIERYDSWREKDPDIVIIHLKKFNRENALEYERKLINQASETPAVDPDVVHRIALYYENRGNYNKASDVYELSLKHKKNNPGILGYYSLSQYENSESDKAKEAAEKALSIEPKNVIALQVMAQIEADDYNWGEAKKWAKKAIDYGCENAEPYYVYAQSLYKLEEKEAARTYYNKAYNLNGYSPLAQKYSQCGGCPFEIVSMSIAFTSHDGKIITDYGQKLYSSKSQYITTKAKLNVLRDESCTIQCKLYCRGLLSTGDNSPSGCTYESELYFFKTGIVEREIGGWGNDTSGNWPAGNYRFEIWYNGEKVGEETFRLY